MGSNPTLSAISLPDSVNPEQLRRWPEKERLECAGGSLASQARGLFPSPPIGFGEKAFLSPFPVGKGWRRPRGQVGFVRDFAAVNPPRSPLIKGWKQTDSWPGHSPSLAARIPTGLGGTPRRSGLGLKRGYFCSYFENNKAMKTVFVLYMRTRTGLFSLMPG